MHVIIVGSGNVAFNLAQLIHKAGHHISHVVSRNSTSGQAIAALVHGAHIIDVTHMPITAQVYIIAVKDNAIQHIVDAMPAVTGIVVHTSGTVPIQVLLTSSTQYGLLYPLQSLLYGNLTIPHIPLVIHANTLAVQDALWAFANTISHTVQCLPPQVLPHIHIAAVLVNNFTNHLYTLAYTYCVSKQLNFDLLLPLIQETTNRLLTYTPAQAQTGPAIRHDEATITKHEAMLSDNAYLLQLYKLHTQGIQATAAT